jgi:REP element-mobilizing transposase RayT
MAQARDRYQIRVFLVCLMPNHVDVVMETPQGNLSAFMRQLLSDQNGRCARRDSFCQQNHPE